MKNKFVAISFLVFIAISSFMVMGIGIDPLEEKLEKFKIRLSTLTDKLEDLRNSLESLSKELTVQKPYMTLVNGDFIKQSLIRKLDGTGPDGFGPMTGRGLGRCNPL